MSYMVAYLTCKQWHNYNLYVRPESQAVGGGMAVKTQRILEALRLRYYTQITDEVEAIDAPVVIVEPLYFTLYNDDEEEPDKHWERLRQLGELAALGTKLILVCSEFEVMRWQPEFREGVLRTFDRITCNCQYQASMFGYFKVNPDAILCDPIPTDLFQTPIKEQETATVLATGNVSWQKNARAVIDTFRKLQKKGIQTAYIGSAHLWGKTKDTFNLQLEDELKSVTDCFHKSLSQYEVVKVMQQSRVGLWVATHECFGQGYAELLSTGRPVATRRHGLEAERPGVSGKSATDKVLKLIDNKNVWEETSIASRHWVKTHVSYERFLEQFSEVIRYL